MGAKLNCQSEEHGKKLCVGPCFPQTSSTSQPWRSRLGRSLRGLGKRVFLLILGHLKQKAKPMSSAQLPSRGDVGGSLQPPSSALKH